MTEPVDMELSGLYIRRFPFEVCIFTQLCYWVHDSTAPIDIAVATAFLRATISNHQLPSHKSKGKERLEGQDLLYRIHPEDDVPQELQYPPTPRIAQRRIHDPLPQPFIIAQRPLQHPVPTNGELRTTCRPDLPGHILRLRE